MLRLSTPKNSLPAGNGCFVDLTAAYVYGKMAKLFQEQNKVLRIKFFFGSFFFQEKGTKKRNVEGGGPVELLSIIVPCFNEEATVERFFDRTSAV